MRLAALLTVLSLPVAAQPAVTLGGGSAGRSATLLGEASLEASYKPSLTPPLRLSDAARFGLASAPEALDRGGGLSSDARQILALILGIIPGFGLGHLIARDRDGFILFLVIDIVLYVAWGVVGLGFWDPFKFVGGVVWLVVHIFQGIDAYGAAGGARLIELNREKAVRLAGLPGREEPVVTTRAFGFSF